MLRNKHHHTPVQIALELTRIPGVICGLNVRGNQFSHPLIDVFEIPFELIKPKRLTIDLMTTYDPCIGRKFQLVRHPELSRQRPNRSALGHRNR